MMEPEKKSLRRFFNKRIETGKRRLMTDGEIYQLCPFVVNADHRKMIRVENGREVVVDTLPIEWCEENCRQMWGVYPKSVLIYRFKDPDDAALFKLTWG